MKSFAIIVVTLASLAQTGYALPANAIVTGSGGATGFNAGVQQTLTHSVVGPDVFASGSAATFAQAGGPSLANVQNGVATTAASATGVTGGGAACVGLNCDVGGISEADSSAGSGNAGNIVGAAVDLGGAAVVSGSTSTSGMGTGGLATSTGNVVGANGNLFSQTTSNSDGTGTISDSVAIADTSNGSVSVSGTASGNA